MRHPNEMDLRTTEDDFAISWQVLRVKSFAELSPLLAKMDVYKEQRKRQFDEIADAMRVR